jgi:hypothetical protein
MDRKMVYSGTTVHSGPVLLNPRPQTLKFYKNCTCILLHGEQHQAIPDPKKYLKSAK